MGNYGRQDEHQGTAAVREEQKVQLFNDLM